MSNNPFSLQGRIKRLPYFLCCLALLVAFSVIMFSLLSGRISDEMLAASAPDEYHATLDWIAHVDTATQLKLIPCLLIYLWLSLVLLFKRTRDMNGSMSFAYVYIVIYLTIFIPILGAVSSFLMLGMNLMLLFKPSTEFIPMSIQDRNDAAEKSDWAEAGSSVIGSDAELVARATDLREQQGGVTAPDSNSPAPRRSNRTAKSFGRRGLQGT